MTAGLLALNATVIAGHRMAAIGSCWMVTAPVLVSMERITPTPMPVFAAEAIGMVILVG